MHSCGYSRMRLPNGPAGGRPLLLILLLSVSINAADLTFRVDVFPRVVAQNGNVRWRCTIPKDAANRRMRGGFEYYRSFEESLDGAAARVIFERVFQEVPCDPGPAYCEVTRNDGKTSRVTAQLGVAGCPGTDLFPDQ